MLVPRSGASRRRRTRGRPCRSGASAPRCRRCAPAVRLRAARTTSRWNCWFRRAGSRGARSRRSARAATSARSRPARRAARRSRVGDALGGAARRVALEVGAEVVDVAHLVGGERPDRHAAPRAPTRFSRSSLCSASRIGVRLTSSSRARRCSMMRSPGRRPNLITFGRLCAVPLAFWLVVEHRLALAFYLFVLAGLSDARWMAGLRGVMAAIPLAPCWIRSPTRPFWSRCM